MGKEHDLILERYYHLIIVIASVAELKVVIKNLVRIYIPFLYCIQPLSAPLTSSNRISIFSSHGTTESVPILTNHTSSTTPTILCQRKLSLKRSCHPRPSCLASYFHPRSFLRCVLVSPLKGMYVRPSVGSSVGPTATSYLQDEGFSL